MVQGARNRSLFWLALFCLAGFGLSAVAVYQHELVKAGLSGSAFCHLGKNFNCEAAIKSGYSELFGIPLASYGMVFYPALLGLVILAADSRFISRKTSAAVLFGIGVFAALLSVVLFLILKLEVKVYCPVCLATYLVNFGILGSAWWLSREFGIVEKLTECIRSVARLPALLLGSGRFGDSQSPWLARFALFTFCLLVFISYTFPDYVIVRYILSGAAEAGTDKIVSAWEESPIQQIGYDAGGALTHDYSKGDPNAPVKIFEFSDFECPACRAVFPMLDALLEEYNGRVFLVYKNFPLDQACNSLINRPFHRHACFAASFARCAGEQGKFWDAADYLVALEAFDNLKDSGDVRREILKGNTLLGLDAAAMQECISSGRQLEKIKKDVAKGVKLEVAATPAIWINGKKVEQLSEDGLRAILDKLTGAKP